MTARYFVSRFDDESVSHLVRITETEATLVGEFFVDGAWRADGSAMDYLLDGTIGDEVDERKAQAIIDELRSGARFAPAPGEPASIGPVTSRSADAIRAGLRSLLPADAPQLPDPIPVRGSLADNGWTVRYALNPDDEGRLGLDVYADHPLTSSLHARVKDDGTALALDTFESELSYDPDVAGDAEAAEARRRAHNARVGEELSRKGLL